MKSFKSLIVLEWFLTLFIHVLMKRLQMFLVSLCTYLVQNDNIIYMLLLCVTRYLTFVCFADFQSDFDEFAMFLMHVMIATFVCLLKRIGKEVVKQ